jgi:hypothetical protein
VIGPIVGATTPLKLQDTLIGGSLSTWGANIALDFVLKGWGSLRSPEELLQARKFALEAVNAATRRGTVIHEHIAQILKGETPTPTAETAPYLYAWANFIATERPEFLAVEQRVLYPVPDLMFAGTLDFIARIRGRVVLGDVKSGKFKRSMALQLAAYSMCDAAGESLTLDQWHRYWWSGDESDLTPLPEIEGYAILLLRADGYELVELDVTQADRLHYLNLVQTFHAMKAWDLAHEPEGVPA